MQIATRPVTPTLRPLTAAPSNQTKLPAVPAAPVSLVPLDRLQVSTAKAAIPATADLFSSKPLTAAPAPRSEADYKAIFKWVETVTGKPIAYQDDTSRQAYIHSIKGKPQEFYDTKGFLANLGVTGVETYGRDDSGVAAVIKSIKYSPDSPEVSKPMRIAQKAMYWFYKTFPKTFDKIASLADKYYLTRKDMKAQSWLKEEVPQPKINPNDPLINSSKIREQYSSNVISQSLAVARPRTTQELFDGLFKLRPPKEIGLLFEDDFHMGTPQPGEAPQNYGTYAIAKRLGFTDDQAKNFATANYDMDLNNTEYGDTDAFPNAMPSKHFNLNKEKPQDGDTRFIWAQRHMDAAIELAKRGRFTEAEREIGYGMHGIQDAFAHGHIRLASHAITDNIPDGVDFNPVAAYEATLASIGYLNEYMKRLNQL